MAIDTKIRRVGMALAMAGLFAAGSCSSESTDDDPTGAGASSGTGSGTSAGTGSGSPGCDTGFECAVCHQGTCAAEYCASEIAACTSEPQCVALVACRADCDIEACFQNCETANPAGVEPYHGMMNCRICVACHEDCSVWLDSMGC